MKTIIKHGNIDIYQVICEKCGCIFQYNDEDILEDDKDFYFRYKVSCPDCGLDIEHSYSNKIEDENRTHI